MFDNILNFFGGDEQGDVALESFTELKQKTINLLKEEASFCDMNPELGHHVTMLGTIIAGIEQINNEDMSELFEKIKAIPPLPETSPFQRSQDLIDLIKSI